jgi:hypothetical protein
MHNRITLRKTILLLFISMLAITAHAQTVIFSENFASADTGNDTSTSGQSAVWNGNANFVTDANSKAYKAGGAVKLGTGSAIGYITSVPLDLSQGGGNFTLNFDVKGWTTVEGSIKITITNIAEQTVTYTANMAAAYETKTLNLTGGTANSTIRIETTAKRAFIDNVIVSVPEAGPDAPVATAATDITYGSFTANWNEVEGAEYYVIEISTTPDFATVLPGWDDWQNVGLSANVTQLTGSTTYYYRVVAVSGDNSSEYSNVIEVTTACGPFTYPAINIVSFCGGAAIADLPLSLSAYHFYTAETGGQPLTEDVALSSGTIYYTHYFDNCESPRQPYLVEITTVDVPVIEANEVEICNSGTIADITPEESGYQWYTEATGGSALAASEALSNGTLYVSRVQGDCESARVEITVEIVVPAEPQGNQLQDFTEGETLADLDVAVDEDLVWFENEELTVQLPATTELVDSTTYYAVNMDGQCMSTPLAVTVSQIAGTGSHNMKGLMGYPNPVDNMYSLRFTEPISNVSVYNMIGQQVMNIENSTAALDIDMTKFTAGTYSVKVVSGTKTATLKVVKQ